MHFEIALIVLLSTLPYCQPITPADIQWHSESFTEITGHITRIQGQSATYCDTIAHQGKHKIDGFEVCYDPTVTPQEREDRTGRKFYVQAIIKNSNIKKGKTTTGTDVTPTTRAWIKTISRPCGCEDGGHIVPQQLGGVGEKFNVFPQNSRLNRGKWSSIELTIYNHLKAGADRSALLRFAFDYIDDNNPYRPTTIFFEHDLRQRNAQGVDVVVGQVMGDLLNEAHIQEGTLREHPYDTINKRQYYRSIVEGFYPEMTCTVPQNFLRFFSNRRQ